MTKREFLKLAGLSLLGRSFTPPPVLPASPPPKNFLWLRPDLKQSPDDLRRTFARWRTAGFHGVNAEIYNGSNALFQSRRLPVKADWLGTAIPIAKAEGLELHAWMWSMPCLIPEIMTAHPDWYNVNAKGESAVDKPAYVNYYKFLDPARPEVREFVQGTVKELAAIPDLTGIHLDYIRHPDAILPSGLWAKYGIVQDKVYPAYDYGYTEYSRQLFKKRTGIDPIELKDPETNAAWMQYRLDSVVDLVNDYLVPAAQAGGKQISAAVFPGPSRARVMVRQDWGRFKLDMFLPMLYHTFYEAGPEFVKQYTEEAVRTVTKPVYSGLFIDPLDAAAFTKTIEMAFAGGASGVSIFDAGAMNAERWALLAKAVAK